MVAVWSPSDRPFPAGQVVLTSTPRRLVHVGEQTALTRRVHHPATVAAVGVDGDYTTARPLQLRHVPETFPGVGTDDVPLAVCSPGEQPQPGTRDGGRAHVDAHVDAGMLETERNVVADAGTLTTADRREAALASQRAPEAALVEDADHCAYFHRGRGS